MAHYVGKVLRMRPNNILDGWGVAELIVAYGQYANEVSNQNFQEWKSMDVKSRKGKKAPQQYAVKFYNFDDLEDVH